jgi:hypothetical protein
VRACFPLPSNQPPRNAPPPHVSMPRARGCGRGAYRPGAARRD